MLKTNEVFGVSNSSIKSYIDREEVDQAFIAGLDNDKHIIVYGSSKQGKTALTNRHLKEEEFIRIDCSPKTAAIDIYKSILRQSDVLFEENREVCSSGETRGNGGVKANVTVPFIGKVEVGAGLESSKSESQTKSYKSVEYNLELAQDISEILKKIDFNKRIILENFHYLDEEVQKTMAFDLRVFEDHNILFIVLGIWREKNRLAQYNGDLQDRFIEIPVEPWKVEDFKRVVSIGEELLNVSFANVIDDILENSFDSIGVFQELCKESCLSAGVNEKVQGDCKIIEKENIDRAINTKLQTYSSRHIRSIESFVEQKSKSSKETPLYLAYYFIKVFINLDFSEIQSGLKRNEIRDKIKEIHHRSDDVRPSDLSYFLHNIVNSQVKKNIVPPLFDYDRSVRMLKVIDSTLYFFIKNYNLKDLEEEIEIPVDISQDTI